MSTNEMSKSMQEDKADDPVLRIKKSREDEAKKARELALEIQKEQLESTKRIIDSRNAAFYKHQKDVREKIL